MRCNVRRAGVILTGLATCPGMPDRECGRNRRASPREDRLAGGLLR